MSEDHAKELADSLAGAIRWLRILCDEADIDPEETTVEVSGVDRKSGDRRPLATVTLAQGLAKFDAALAEYHAAHQPNQPQGRAE